MNKVILKGNIVNDLNLEKTGEKSYLRFTLAVQRAYKKDEVDFIDCIAFRQAEFISKYFKKGYPILVEGSLKISIYEKDGEKRNSTSIVIENVYFCERKGAETSPENTVVVDEDNDPLPF